MSDRETAEALFLEHLAWINRAAFAACARFGVLGADAEDVASRVRMALVEDDYRVVRRFEGNSSIKTYLATVATNHVYDFIRDERGRWRPSAAAERLGPPAPTLEEMVHREGYTVGQAGEKLRTAGRTTLTDTQLARMLSQLPVRAPLRPIVQDARTGTERDLTPGVSRADDRVVESEAERLRQAVLTALNTSLDQLEGEDRLIVQMHFEQGLTLASVARAMGLEQKPLYRRVDRLRGRLRGHLEALGFDQQSVLAFLRGFDAP